MIYQRALAPTSPSQAQGGGQVVPGRIAAVDGSADRGMLGMPDRRGNASRPPWVGGDGRGGGGRAGPAMVA